MPRNSLVARALTVAWFAGASWAQGPLLPTAPWAFHDPGPFTPASADWDDGNVSVTNPFGGTPLSVHHFGVVWFPGDAAGNVLDPKDGHYPLVVFAHGRFQSPPFTGSNHKQATYLLSHLASWGCVVASVNLDVVGQFQTPPGIPQRGELINKTVEFMSALPPFNKAVDFSRIVYIGHSRGGEGVFAAVQQNPPWKASIRGIGAIAPTNFTAYALPESAFVIYGSQDGDVNNGMPIQLYDQTSMQSMKGFRFIEGANHFFFTDSITYSGEGTPQLTRPQHQEIAKTYFATWASAMHFGDRASLTRIAGDVEMQWSAPFAIHRIFNNPLRFTVDNFEQAPANALLNTLGGANALTNLIGAAEKSLTTLAAPSYFHKTAGLVTQWNAPAEYRADLGADVNVSAFPFVSVNVLQTYNAPLNVFGQPQQFHLELIDAAGQLASIPNTDVAPWPYPASVTPNGSPKKSVLKTFRFPLTAFTAQNPALDLTTMRQVAVRFDVTPSGDAAIDEVSFTP